MCNKPFKIMPAAKECQRNSILSPCYNFSFLLLGIYSNYFLLFFYIFIIKHTFKIACFHNKVQENSKKLYEV